MFLRNPYDSEIDFFSYGILPLFFLNDLNTIGDILKLFFPYRSFACPQYQLSSLV